MKKIEYFINLLHYVIYIVCKKYKRFLPDFSADINSGRIIGLLFALLGFAFFVLLNKMLHRFELASEFIFLFIALFGILLFFTVFYKDKYFVYFKEFEKETKEVKKRWILMTFLFFVFLIFLLVFSFWLPTNVA